MCRSKDGGHLPEEARHFRLQSGHVAVSAINSNRQAPVHSVVPGEQDCGSDRKIRPGNPFGNQGSFHAFLYDKPAADVFWDPHKEKELKKRHSLV